MGRALVTGRALRKRVGTRGLVAKDKRASLIWRPGRQFKLHSGALAHPLDGRPRLRDNRVTDPNLRNTLTISRRTGLQPVWPGKM